MNRHMTTERCHDPLAMLTRCSLEEREREVVRYSQTHLVRAERTSHEGTAFRRLVQTWWRALRARITGRYQQGAPVATTEQ